MNHGFKVELNGREVTVRSDLPPDCIQAVEARFKEGLQDVREGQENHSTEEVLFLVALNTTQKLLDAEAQVDYLSRLLDSNGYPPKQ